MSDEYGLARTAHAADDLVSPAEQADFQDALLRLLERRTLLYTMGDSSSVPTYVAADLLRSICFVLGIDPEEPIVPEQLPRVDLESEFTRRLAEVGSKVEATERLWRDVCVAMPLIPNVALRDTLADIGSFFSNYDHRWMAHDIPCSIDYPLCHPVDESTLGVDYIAEYLRRLMIEARFLRCFEIERCERVLASASPDHIELLVNLYEPVAIDAIGLALIGQDPRGLMIGDVEREAIAGRLDPLASAQRGRALQDATSTVCDALGVLDEHERAYLSALVPELLARTDIGLAHGGLGGVYVG